MSPSSAAQSAPGAGKADGTAAEHAGPDHDANSPTQFSFAGWRAVLGRVWTGIGTHNVGLMAAGVAFYAFLSIVPVFGALVMTYGLFADPATVAQHMQTVINLVPKDAAKLIYDQLMSVSTTAKGKAGLGLLIAILVSIYGATRASGAMMSALNVIYEEKEQRNIVRTTLVSMALILGAVMVGIVGLLAGTLLGYLGTIVATLGLGLGPIGAFVIKIATCAHRGRGRGLLSLRAGSRECAMALAQRRLGAGDFAVGGGDDRLRLLCRAFRQLQRHLRRARRRRRAADVAVSLRLCDAGRRPPQRGAGTADRAGQHHRAAPAHRPARGDDGRLGRLTRRGEPSLR